MKKIASLIATGTFVFGVMTSGLTFAADAATTATAEAAPAAAKQVTKKAAAKPAAKSSAFKTEEQKVSYSIGVNIAHNLQQMKQQAGFAVDANLVAQGLKDAISGGKTKMSNEEMQATMQAFSQKMQAKQKEAMAAHEAEMKKAGDKNAADGKAYLDANAKKDGVTVTKSGIQYKVLTEGKGPKPKATDTVTVNYRGTLTDGKEFDSSYKRGEPATFAVNAVIPGWTEVLQLMPEGSKWEVTIPSDLAYGPGGAGGDIGPNATLIFEIELLKASGDSGDK